MSSWVKPLQHGNRGVSFRVSLETIRPSGRHRALGQRAFLVREIEESPWSLGRERRPVGRTAAAALGNGDEAKGIETAADKCWLVGAGPGAADLLTVRACGCLTVSHAQRIRCFGNDELIRD